MDTLKWRENALFLIDQTLLPRQKVIIECKTYKDVAKAIKEMNVRGAPAIGVTAAYGMVLGAFEYDGDDKEAFFDYLNDVGDVIKGTRPTAVNLFWAVDRILNRADEVRDKDITSIKIVLEEEANRMAREDIDTNRCMGHYGAQLLKDGDTVLTHCNAGALATVDYGTALGVIRAAVEEGKNISVFADETRPYLQGARLTAWELMEDNIPVTLITDNMAGYVMKKGLINAVIVGADRIAANGDVANKIGTYSVAVLAKENNIPFYVVAPISTLDLDIKAGDDIPIEERSSMEVTHICGVPIAPEGVKVMNPAFDVTPNKYITGIITEEGVIYPPYNKNLQKVGKK